MSEAPDTRRPIPQRSAAWAQRLAAWLAHQPGITPNRISQASLAFAMLAGLCLWLGPGAGGSAGAVLLLGGAAFVLLRLLANMFDGMVAVEGGRGAADGAFWNEMPDRGADLAILVGAGYGAGLPELGWAAGAMAIATAYVRAFGEAHGQTPDYSGPMAKPHRMWAVIAAALIGTAVSPPLALAAALWVVALGGALTALLRARRLLLALRAGEPRDPAAR